MAETNRRASPGTFFVQPAFGLGMALALSCSSCGGDAAPNAAAGGATTAGAAANGGSGGGTAGTGATGGASLGGAGGGSAGATSAGSAGASGSGAGQGGAGNTAGGSGAAGSDGGGTEKSAGCGKMRTLEDGNRMVMSGGTPRTYALRVPADYDNEHAYRLILGFHGATNSSSDVAPSYFGLWELSQGSTIFAAPDAVNGIWQADTDTQMVQDLLEQLQNDLCIDTSRIVIEGFSQGGAMTWTLACALPGTFSAAIVHSGGGLAMPETCQPIPFMSSLGHDGSGQDMSSDFFAMTNGCTVESLPEAPTGGHACTNYEGCSAGRPTRWCAYDGGHTPAPTDSGQSQSWMPEEVWTFLQQF